MNAQPYLSKKLQHLILRNNQKRKKKKPLRSSIHLPSLLITDQSNEIVHSSKDLIFRKQSYLPN